MKKSNFYVKMAVLFLSGALLCGIGAGVCFAEWSGLETVKAEETAKTDEKDYILPQNEILYLQQINPANVNVTADENVESGHMIIKTACTENSEIHYYNYETCTLEDNSSGNPQKWRVKVLDMPDVYSSSDDFENFKEMLEHLKKKEIYYHSDTRPEFEIKVNPADRDRIVCLWDHADMTITYDDADAAETFSDDDSDKEWEDELEDELEEAFDDEWKDESEDRTEGKIKVKVPAVETEINLS